MHSRLLDLPGQPLAYYESSGTGPAALLIHGNSASGRAFERQLAGEIGARFRLVALDLPGHGESGRAPNSATYSLPGYAATVAAAARALGLERAALVGWSLGGHIALEAHNLLPDAAGFVIFGTPPLAFPPAMEAAFLPNPAVNIGFKVDVTPDEATAYARSFFDPRADIDPQPFVDDILRTDGAARAGLAASIKPNGYQDEVQIVANLRRPLAIVHGAAEQLVSESYISALAMPTLWRNSVQIISGAGHAPHWEQPAAFNALLEAFLTQQ
jgi:pimeloyl-ACP methyl ester carboxylesterase